MLRSPRFPAPLLAVLFSAGLATLLVTELGPARRGEVPPPARRPGAPAPRLGARSPQPAPDTPRAEASRRVEVPAWRRDTWSGEEVMVALEPGADAEELARRHGSRLLRPAGPSGYAALAVPEGRSPADFAGELAAEPGVRDAARVAWLRGAGLEPAGELPGDPDWYLRALDLPASLPGAFSELTVAIVDSGVACSPGAGADCAPGLDPAQLLPGLDLVDGGEPWDEHGHGTHLAQLVAGERGVAPGARVLPVRVLDERERGTELDLVDGLYWAVDQGADVIDLSLSLPPGYVPSRALLGALEHAAGEGVVVVAAAGNYGATFTTWPAADPRVLAVGAATPAPGGGLEPAPYTDLGPALDLLAPGGAIDRDADGDGLPDGLLAWSLPPGHPEDGPALLAMAGTSQAAALVAGAALHLLAAGAAPDEVPALLQLGADPGLAEDPEDPWAEGLGAGLLDLRASLDALAEGAPEPRQLSVRLLPYLAELSPPGAVLQYAEPRARVLVFDEEGRPVDGARVLGLFLGDEHLVTSCTTEGGACTLRGRPESITDALGDVLPLAWAFTADAVLLDGVAWHPASAPPGSACARALERSVELHPALRGERLAFWWDEQRHPLLGPLVEAAVVLDAGDPALGSRPFAALATPTVLEREGLEARSLPLPGGACSAGVVETLLGRLPPLSRPLLFTSLDPVDAAGEACLDALGLGAPRTGRWERPDLLASSLVGDGALEVSGAAFPGSVEGTGALVIGD